MMQVYNEMLSSHKECIMRAIRIDVFGGPEVFRPVDIPPPPPDLDCGEIPYRRFRVLRPDPHRFDGDKDGIGCE
jgi:micrococcal nuclease